VTAAGTRQLREWVEQLAAQLERDGLPRMAGRIFAWLLVCEPAEQRMEDLAAALQGSRASMSTMTRLLEGAGLVERVRRPGARSDVFRMPQGHWGSFWDAQLVRLRALTATLARGAELMGDRPPAARRRVEDVLEQYRFLERELPALLARRQAGATRHENVTPARPGPGAPSRPRGRPGDHRARRA
jgi:DNA-binding transcriptional regulator GbsR (MarR family)